MKKSLTLIDVKLVTFKDGGEKMKHLFVDADGKPFTGWTDVGEELPKEQIELSGAYVSARARDYETRVDEYQGRLRYNVDCTPISSPTT